MNNIHKRFTKFHKTNPHIYQLLVKFAKDAKSAGLKHYSVKALFERVRWHQDVEIGGSPYRMNNYFTSQYARYIMDHNSDLAGFFETRKLRGV